MNLETLNTTVLTVMAFFGPRGGQENQQAGSGFEMFLPMIIIFAIFYFLLIRPQTKRQKEHQNMLSELKKGDRVITSGGIMGTIVGINDRVVSLRIGDKVKINVLRSTISSLDNEPEESVD